jgi:hypothetical protein
MLIKCIYFNFIKACSKQNNTPKTPINLQRIVGIESNKNPGKGCCCATQHFSINKQFALYNISAVTIATVPLSKISELQACLLAFLSVFSRA